MTSPFTPHNVYTMDASPDLQYHITTLIGMETITSVVETGSYLGLGTTKAVLKGMRVHGFDYEFYSIECNPTHYRQAVKNNEGQKVNFILGKTLPKSMEPINLSFENIPDDVFIDFTPETRDEMYRSEINFNVPDDQLGKVFSKLKPEMVILDSAGHLGLIEFNYTMQLLKGHSFWLVLDDIQHIKHYHSMQIIRSRPDDFEVVWESEPDELHRAAIIRVNGNGM